MSQVTERCLFQTYLRFFRGSSTVMVSSCHEGQTGKDSLIASMKWKYRIHQSVVRQTIPVTLRVTDHREDLSLNTFQSRSLR